MSISALSSIDRYALSVNSYVMVTLERCNYTLQSALKCD